MTEAYAQNAIRITKQIEMEQKQCGHLQRIEPPVKTQRVGVLRRGVAVDAPDLTGEVVIDRLMSRSLHSGGGTYTIWDLDRLMIGEVEASADDVRLVQQLRQILSVATGLADLRPVQLGEIRGGQSRAEEGCCDEIGVVEIQLREVEVAEIAMR